jgi:hypothetical protein
MHGCRDFGDAVGSGRMVRARQAYLDAMRFTGRNDVGMVGRHHDLRRA